MYPWGPRNSAARVLMKYMLSRVRGRALTKRAGNEGNGLLGFGAAHRLAFALWKGYQVVEPLQSGLHVTSLYAEAKETCGVQLSHTHNCTHVLFLSCLSTSWELSHIIKYFFSNASFYHGRILFHHTAAQLLMSKNPLSWHIFTRRAILNVQCYGTLAYKSMAAFPFPSMGLLTHEYRLL